MADHTPRTAPLPPAPPQNINEFSKLRLLQRSLRQTAWADYDFFRDVDAQIRAAPEQFFLPRAMADHFSFAETPDFVFPPKGWSMTAPDGRPIPGSTMWSILPPDDQCTMKDRATTGPDCLGGWQPSEAMYAQAQRAMATGMGQRAFLGLPRLDSTAKVVVVFLDGIFCNHHLEQAVDAMLKERYPSAALLLPIRSHCDGHPADAAGDPVQPNAYIHDAHLWWAGILSLYLPAPPGASMHVWPPEYAQFVGSEYDAGFTYSNTVAQFLAVEQFNEVDTIVLHILLGTHEVAHEVQGAGAGAGAGNNTDGGAAVCAQREALLGMAVRHALRVASRRLVVADYNGNLPVGANTCAVSPQTLERLVRRQTQGHTAAAAAGGGGGGGGGGGAGGVGGEGGAGEDGTFRVVDTRYVPGEGRARRNVFVVVDKVKALALDRGDDRDRGDRVVDHKAEGTGGTEGVGKGEGALPPEDEEAPSADADADADAHAPPPPPPPPATLVIPSAHLFAEVVAREPQVARE
jgi:hypothetical protein